MSKRKKFRGTITTRYPAAEKDTYNQVMLLAERSSIPKSKMQLILIKQGLKYPNHKRLTKRRNK